MGRRRISNPLKLPERLYAHRGGWLYKPKGKGLKATWFSGDDIKDARAFAIASNQDHSQDTLAAIWPHWIDSLRARVGRDKKDRGIAPRTLKDYETDGRLILAYMGHYHVTQVTPATVNGYLEESAALNRPTRGNREKATLSVFFSWYRTREGALVTHNPCLGVRRNPEERRGRYVTDDEYRRVYALAPENVQIMMTLIYRTLQRPGDILKWSQANLVQTPRGRAIAVAQSKRGAELSVLLSGDLETAVSRASESNGMEWLGPWVRREDGMAITYSGLCANFKKAVKKAGLESSFGLYDLKAKGATDMFSAGEDVRVIQQLCGHKDPETTRIYIKRFTPVLSEANSVKMA
jgi:site-specific recombinase XerD